MTYNINTKIGDFTVTNYLPSKGEYTLLCACGVSCKGPKSYVSKRIKLLDTIGYVGCKNCLSIYRKDYQSDDKLIRVFNKYKKRAKSTDKEFSLSIQEALKLFKSECFYCGQEPSNIETTNKVVYQGIDRMDNHKGYSIDNVVPCCKQCNYFKHKQSFEEFMRRVERIYLRNVQRLSGTPEYTQVSGNREHPSTQGDDIV